MKVINLEKSAKQYAADFCKKLGNTQPMTAKQKVVVAKNINIVYDLFNKKHCFASSPFVASVASGIAHLM